MITKYAYQLKKYLPSPIYKFFAKRYIDYGFPRHLFLELTATCNLTCGYCPREKVRQDMDFRLFKEIVDEASQFGSRSFSLHLFGEPLLYPCIFEAVRYIKEKNKSHIVLLTTNGTKINECINELIQSDIDKCLWTWRTEAKFTATTREKLKKWKPFTVRFIEGTYPSEVKKEKWPRVESRRMHNYGANINTSIYTSRGSNVLSAVSKQISNSRWPCYHLWMAPAVAWNGNILICCADPHQKEVLGKFPEMSVSEAWQSGKLAKIRTSHLEGNYEGICKDCDVWKEYPSFF